MKRILNLVFVVAAAICSAPAQATIYDWTYQATIARADDLLGLNGQQLSISLKFDSNNTWKSGISHPSYLYFDALAASASISGHTVSLNTAAPAALQWNYGMTHFAEAFDASSFLDLIIDGITTEMFMWIDYQSPAVANAMAGDHLLISQLPTDADHLFDGFWYPGATARLFYDFTQESIRITAVPEPASMALIVLGLAGLVGVRRRSRRNV